MFFSAMIAVAVFMIAGPISLIITIPMMVFAALAKTQKTQDEPNNPKRKHTVQREWKQVGVDPDTGRPIIQRKYD